MSMITNSRGDNESPWNIPSQSSFNQGRFFHMSAQLSKISCFLSSFSKSLHLHLDFPDSLQINEWGSRSYAFRWSIHAIARFLFLLFTSCSNILLMYYKSLVPRDPILQPFFSSGSKDLCSRNVYVSSAIIAVRIFHANGKHVIGL